MNDSDGKSNNDDDNKKNFQAVLFYLLFRILVVRPGGKENRRKVGSSAPETSAQSHQFCNRFGAETCKDFVSLRKSCQYLPSAARLSKRIIFSAELVPPSAV